MVSSRGKKNKKLLKAAADGDESKVLALIAGGADVNAKTKGGDTPLHKASWASHAAVAEVLLAKGANVDAKDDDGWAPLHWAGHEGDAAVAEVLLANGASVDAKDGGGGTPLHTAGRKGHAAVAEVLLAKGANVDAKDDGGCAPLHLAGQEGDGAALAEVLLAKGADVNLKNNGGETPRDLAAAKGRADVIEVLDKAEADPNSLGKASDPPVIRLSGKVSSDIGAPPTTPEIAIQASSSELPPSRRAFASMRFDGVVPGHAEQLQAAMRSNGADLQIIAMTGGGDIDHAVIEGIMAADYFIVFGSAKYGENTGNPASTYFESKFAQNQKKKIILIRMIPFHHEFVFSRARFMFGLNMLELVWMLGEPMPAELPGQVLEAMGLAGRGEVAALITTVAKADATAGVGEDELLVGANDSETPRDVTIVEAWASEALLAKGAGANAKNDEGKAPRDDAAAKSRADIEVLDKAQADPDIPAMSLDDKGDVGPAKTGGEEDAANNEEVDEWLLKFLPSLPNRVLVNYRDQLIEQGFDSSEMLAHVEEGDLEFMKIGHKRVLSRKLSQSRDD